MVVALPILADIIFWVGCLIFILLCYYIVKALFKITGTSLGWIPGVGGWLKSGVHSIEQRIVSVMSEGVAACDAQIGAGFHALARIIDWMGREIRAHSNLIATIASLLVGVPSHALVSAIHRALHSSVLALYREWSRFVRWQIGIEKRLAHGIGEAVLPRTRALERKVGNVIAHDLPRLRTADRTLARDVTALGKWVRSHALVAGSLAFAGAVALALGRLGLGWTRCSKVGQAGKNLCGMDAGLLESLLADSLLVVGSLSLVEFAQEMVGVTDLAVRPITDFWRAS